MKTDESFKKWLTRFKKTTTPTPPLDLYFLGDGLGESVVGILENKFVFVVDAFGGTKNTITKTLLDGLGIKTISYLQVSHLHQDHYAGLHVLLEAFEVERFGRPNLVKYQDIVSVARFIEAKEQNSTEEKATSIRRFLAKVKDIERSKWSEDPTRYLHLGTSSVICDETFDGIRFKIDCVAPIATQSEKFIEDLSKEVKKLEENGPSYIGSGFLNKFDPAINRTSVINRISYGSVMSLLTGDTESRVIDAYRKNSSLEGSQRAQTILVKVPHHGSNTSDADLLFDQKFTDDRRKIAVLAPFDSQELPVDEVIQRYIASGYEVYRTSQTDGKPSLEHNGTLLPDGVVHVRLEANGEAEVSTWGTARVY